MTTTTANTEAMQAQLVARAWNDEAFRQLLLSDPKAAIAQELGVEAPQDLQIEVVEETPGKLYLVLPARELQPTELSEEQLDTVVGGRGRAPARGYPLFFGFGRMADMLNYEPPQSSGEGDAIPITLP